MIIPLGAGLLSWPGSRGYSFSGFMNSPGVCSVMVMTMPASRGYDVSKATLPLRNRKCLLRHHTRIVLFYQYLGGGHPSLVISDPDKIQATPFHIDHVQITAVA